MQSTLYVKVKTDKTQDDNLCISDAQVDIHLKVLFIKLNSVVFLLIARG